MARRRGTTAALQAAISTLIGAAATRDVAKIAVEQAVALLGARCGAFFVLSGDGRDLEHVVAGGAPEEEAIRSAPPGHEQTAATLAAADAVRSGKSVWLESSTQLRERYPQIGEAALRAGTGALAAVPLTVRGRPLGALTLVFHGPRRFSPADRTLAATLADACALALERAQLLESERRLRIEAEKATSLVHQFDQFRLLVEQVKDYAIFVLDPAGNVRTWNLGAERIKGYRADEIVGSHLSRFYPEEDVRAGKPERELAAAASNGRFEDEGIRVRKDGSMFWASVVITALRDGQGELRGFAKVTRDITERQRAEEERIRLARLEEGAKARDEFLAIASHELKTPITSLGLHTELLLRLREQDGQALQSSARPRLQTIRRQTAKLAHLVQALLDVTHIASGRLALRPERFDLVSVVRDAMERWRAEFSRARCELDVRLEGSIPGRWDRGRIEQVIDNLLANAVKFGAGQPVEVAAEAEGARARVIVRDHGIGIAPEDQRRIFERFERAVPTRHYGGFGLGLWIVRNIVEAHGGDVRVWSQPGQGSRFEFTLPRELRSA
jgi:PAS domain S-box-containing protein